MEINLDLFVLMQIERHTYNMLQCHPHPGDFSDKSRPFHHCYFMGLQRKQGVPASGGGEQFDIRLTAEEFKHSVNMYTLWKPGMEIYLSHVKRRSIPNFVFPGGIRPSRASKGTWDSRRSSELKASDSTQVDRPSEVTESLDVDDRRKRMRVDDNANANLRNGECLTAVHFHPEEVHEVSQVSATSSCSIKDVNSILTSSNNLENLADVSSQNNGSHGLIGLGHSINIVSAAADSSTCKEAEKLAIQKVLSDSYDPHQAFPCEPKELEDFDSKNQAKDLGATKQGSPLMPLVANTSSEVVPMTSCNEARQSPSSYPNGGLEELEVLHTLTKTLFFFQFFCTYIVGCFFQLQLQITCVLVACACKRLNHLLEGGLYYVIFLCFLVLNSDVIVYEMYAILK